MKSVRWLTSFGTGERSLDYLKIRSRVMDTLTRFSMYSVRENPSVLKDVEGNLVHQLWS